MSQWSQLLYATLLACACARPTLRATVESEERYETLLPLPRATEKDVPPEPWIEFPHFFWNMVILDQ